MAFNKTLNNSGGKVLIGNYAEERFLTEQYGPDATSSSHAAVQFKAGNKDIIASGGTIPDVTEFRSNYMNPSTTAVQTQSRTDRLKQEAFAQAVQQIEAEDAVGATGEASTADKGAFLSTTHQAFAAPTGTTTKSGAPASQVDVPDAPATLWNPSGSSTHSRTAKFTEGMSNRVDIDNLIATRQL